MRNIRLTIEYDGTDYCGWQRQRNKRIQKLSVQEAIENCLRGILRQKILLNGSGRTDSGVHSFGQVANFKTSSGIEADKLRLALNGNLPRDIKISAAKDVALGFHSRYSVKSKLYRYLILNQAYESPFLRNYAYWLKQPLDINTMKKACRSLLGLHNFKAFCASGSSVKDTKRTIKRISINKQKSFSRNLICVEIEANGFLRNMVRNIVGTLIEVGRRRFAPDYIEEIIKRKDRSLAGPCVPAQGLYLVEVNY